MRKLKKKENIIRILICVMAILIISLSIAIVVISHKQKSVQTANYNVGNSLVAAQDELSSLRDEASRKNDEAASYSQSAQEQDSAFASERDELSKKISELNKQIAFKKAQQTSGPAQPTPKPVPQTPSADGSNKTVYLTFDDGPSPNTLEILRILEENGVKATFFVINGKHNDYMKNIVNSGNAIGLHTYSHDYSSIYSSETAYYNDLQAISDVVYNETGVRADIMRFPGGSSNTVSRKYCEGIMSRVSVGVVDKGYKYFDWNLSSGDANKNGYPKENIIENCKKLPKSNTVIVLMHDSAAKKTTVEALPEVIAYYKSIGCSFGVITSSTPAIHQKVAN